MRVARLSARQLAVMLALLLGWQGVSAGQIPKIADRYALAARFLHGRAPIYIRNASVLPHWIADQDAFWYVRTSEAGARQFVRVDAATGRREPAFDHRALATAIGAVLKRPVSGDDLPFEAFEYVENGKAIQFSIDGASLRCRLAHMRCEPIHRVAPDPREVLSPDGRWAVFSKDHNLWIRDKVAGTAVALTDDGTADLAYGAAAGQNTHFVSDLRTGENQAPLVSWSPDSRRLLTHRMDLRGVREMALVQAAPEDGSPGPRIWRYRGAVGTDSAWPVSMPVIIDIGRHTVTPVALPPVRDDLDSNIELQFAWWSMRGDRVYFIERAPYYRAVHLHSIDPVTGKATRLVTETSKTFVHIAEDYGWPKVRTTSRDDIIWYSERDGYGHLYRYDAAGRLQCRLTAGDWMVREIVRIDEVGRRVFFVGSGREAGLDPYFLQLYSVGYDCKNLRRLTPEAAHHGIEFTPRVPPNYQQARGLSPFTATNSLSASSRFFVDTFSTPDQPPQSVLRRSDGSLVAVLETADLSRLQAGGFTTPEPFSVVARDNKTRLYGTLFKPSYFNPAQRYPIIDAVYLGPQVTRVNKGFVDGLFEWDSAATQALAELGFIVMTFDPRGSPYRSKTDYNFSYGANLSGSGNLIDHVDAIKALAKTRPYIDLDRVGVSGHSSGGYTAARAMLLYPAFYKVGVSSAGVHDPFGYIPWYTTYVGPDVDQDAARHLSNIALADRLEGKLLLIHGEMDDNVHPFLTGRLVNALLAHDKTFDLLIVPNANHDVAVGRREVVKRSWDHLVTHLRGETPPTLPIPDAP